MIVKKIKFIDFDGDEHEESHYFNLNSREYVKLTSKYISKDGSADLEEYLKHLLERKNSKEMFDFIEDVILTAYGVRSADGRKFVKTKDIREEFEYSFAYAELFELLMRDPSEMEKFANGLIRKPESSGRKAGELKALTGE